MIIVGGIMVVREEVDGIPEHTLGGYANYEQFCNGNSLYCKLCISVPVVFSVDWIFAEMFRFIMCPKRR